MLLTCGPFLCGQLSLEHFGPPLNVISQLFPAGTWDSKHYRKIVSQTHVGQGSELLSVSSLPSR